MNIFRKIAKKITIKNIGQVISNIWSKGYKIIFTIYLIGVLGYGAYVWYQNLYGDVWSADEKQKYINEKSKKTVLNEKAFGQVMDDIKNRKSDFEKDYEPIKDIFMPYAGNIEEDLVR